MPSVVIFLLKVFWVFQNGGSASSVTKSQTRNERHWQESKFSFEVINTSDCIRTAHEGLIDSEYHNSRIDHTSHSVVFVFNAMYFREFLKLYAWHQMISLVCKDMSQKRWSYVLNTSLNLYPSVYFMVRHWSELYSRDNLDDKNNFYCDQVIDRKCRSKILFACAN